MRETMWLKLLLSIFLLLVSLSFADSEIDLDDTSLELRSKSKHDDILPEPLPPVIGKMVDINKNGKEKTISSNTRKDNNKSMMVKSVDDKTNFLIVEKSLTNITKDTGDTVRMKCEFRGHPAPEILWYKNEAPLELERGKIDVRKYTTGQNKVGSRLRILYLDIHDMGYYKCEATNGRIRTETTGVLVVKAGRMNSPSMIPNFPPPFPHFPALGGRLPDFEEDALGFCQQYRGVACSQLIANKTVYIKAKTTINQMEENLATLFALLAASKEISPDCHKYAVPYFCFVLLPPCDDTAPYPVPRHVCKEDCVTLETSTCKDELMTIKKHAFLSQHNLLPKCSELPSLQEHSAPSPAMKDTLGSCMNLHVPTVLHVDNEQMCYVGHGETYRGPISHTMSTHKCQPWSQTTEYEELSGSHNYCRNPGGLESQPWCFISDPHIRREICDIPKCSDYSWLYIVIPTLTTAVLLVALIILWCKKQRRKSTLNKLSPQGPNAQLIPTHHQNPQIIHSQQQIEMQKFLPRIPVCIREISPSSIRYLHELGDGVFGKVYRGELTNAGSNVISLVQPVAIKTLRDSASTTTQQEFCRELESIAVLQHPNVVCLVGVCIRDEPLCMLFEYMFQCDLHEYLLVHSPHSDVSARSEDGTPHILELADFLVISIQIASGMEYLSSKRYVHRDLAARNCLVSADAPTSPNSQVCLPANTNLLSTISDIVVKISDLGVSRNSCASDYFRIRNTLLPVRWMAPESLLYGTFSTESDVWSFGVLLWEIFSYGIQPYFNYDNQEVIDLVCAHQLLPRPEYCPSYVYSIMNDCWHDTSSHRAGFKEIYNRLCSVQTLHERAFSISHSVLTHNSSHPSSTGPSNKTLSTNISGGTVGTVTPNSTTVTNGTPSRPPHNRQQTGLGYCHGMPGFVTSQMIPGHRTHQCEQV